MKTHTFLTHLFLCGAAVIKAQGVLISAQPGNPHSSAMLEIQGTQSGVLINRVVLTGAQDAQTILTPAKGLLVYHTGSSGMAEGFYVNMGTPIAVDWRRLQPSPGNASLDMNGQAIQNVPAPVNQGDAVNKAYVDNLVAASAGASAAAPTMVSAESSASYNFSGAIQYCKSLNEGGFTNWRLPSFDELIDALSNPAIILSNPTSSNALWTRSIHGYNTSYAEQTYIAFVLNNGSSYQVRGSNTNRVRCVR
jgi:hypothetical protein